MLPITETETSQTIISLEKIFDYLMSSQLQEILFPLKIVFILISLGFLGAIIYFIKKTDIFKWQFLKALKYFFAGKALEPAEIVKKWEKFKENLRNSEAESQWKLCLIDAFSFFDQILEKMGYSGATLNEKLEKIPSNQKINLEELFQIQETYQTIIENPAYPLEKKEVEKIFEILEKTLFALEILS